MWDAIAVDIWSRFKGEWSIIGVAPVSFCVAVLLSTFLTYLALSKYLDGKHRDKLAVMTATIEHQRELLAGHREREEKAEEIIAEITQKPEFRLLLVGGNLFVPNEQPSWTGFNVLAKLWNTGAPGVAVSWSLAIIPKGQMPVIARWTRRPPKILASGSANSSVMRASEGLDVKTSDTPVGNIPVLGEILFYTSLEQHVVQHPETWIELSVMDVLQNETVAKQCMGTWLQR